MGINRGTRAADCRFAMPWDRPHHAPRKYLPMPLLARLILASRSLTQSPLLDSIQVVHLLSGPSPTMPRRRAHRTYLPTLLATETTCGVGRKPLRTGLPKAFVQPPFH